MSCLTGVAIFLSEFLRPCLHDLGAGGGQDEEAGVGKNHPGLKATTLPSSWCREECRGGWFLTIGSPNPFQGGVFPGTTLPFTERTCALLP